MSELSIHSLRAGGALYRHFEGAELEDVMLQAYWKSPATAEHYLQILRIANVAGHECSAKTSTASGMTYLLRNCKDSCLCAIVARSPANGLGCVFPEGCGVSM